MTEHNVNGVVYYSFKHIDDTGITRHCFTTRAGGVSAGFCESMNLSFGRGDSTESVTRNYEIIGRAVGFSPENMVSAKQTHGVCVHIADERDRGKGVTVSTDIHEVDGFVTAARNVVLTTFHADCVPLYFVDPTARVVALAHAGWRGTLNRIAAETVQTMKTMGSRPESILVGIGPSIGPCCFETDAPVAEQFMDGFAAYVSAKEGVPGKYYIDLWAVNRQIMMENGVKGDNIETAEICTMCNHRLFFSHRYHGEKRGGMAAFIGLI